MSGAEPAAAAAAGSAIGLSEVAPFFALEELGALGLAGEMFPAIMPELTLELLGAEMFGPELMGAAFDLPFDLSTSDLLQGGLRLGGYMMQDDAYDDYYEDQKNVMDELTRKNRGYTNDVMGVIDKMGNRNTPASRAAAYDEAAGKQRASLGEAMTEASNKSPSFSSGGADVSSRYADAAEAAKGTETNRIAELAKLMGNLNAHGDREIEEGINTALDSSTLNTIGSDRRSTNRWGNLALSRARPNGTKMMAGDLMDLGADLMGSGKLKFK